jgi:hypothetical protein
MPITNIFLEPAKEERKDAVLNYHIDFDQRTDDRTGKPVGRPILTQFSIRIRRDSEPEANFYVNWQLEPTLQQDLDICFYDDNQLKRSIKIQEAYLVSYNQDCREPGAIEETLVISPQKVEMDGIMFNRQDYQ